MLNGVNPMLDRLNKEPSRAFSAPDPMRDVAALSIEPSFSLEETANLFRAWDCARGILLAVSGGPDSVALMLLAAAWAHRRSAPPLSVATVNHGLRPDSRSEAEQVDRWAAALGLPHEILDWDGPKPRSRIQELARQARYDLLFRHAARIGADIVATAHHADDQAETILFRLLRGSGIGGLAGMPDSRERHGLIHSRPLLLCGKAQLVAYCAAHGHPYFEDPSNRNPAYARTRMRALGRAFAEHGLDRAALLRLGRRAARAEAALTERTQALRADLPARREPGRFSADISSLADQPEEILLRILGFEIKALSDAARPLRLARLESLTLALQQALRAGAPFAATLGGASLQLSQTRILTIRRESGRRRGLANLPEPPCSRS